MKTSAAAALQVKSAAQKRDARFIAVRAVMWLRKITEEREGVKPVRPLNRGQPVAAPSVTVNTYLHRVSASLLTAWRHACSRLHTRAHASALAGPRSVVSCIECLPNVAALSGREIRGREREMSHAGLMGGTGKYPQSSASCHLRRVSEKSLFLHL